MRIILLGLLELSLGVVWGLVWSVYSRSLVDSGFDGLSYGVLGLAMSLATFLAYFTSSLSYYYGLSKPVMPLSAVLIGLSYYLLYTGRYVELVPLMAGFAWGSHTVSVIRTASMLSRGNPNVIALVYSLSLLGFSIGSIAITLGYSPSPVYILVASLISGLVYQSLQVNRGVYVSFSILSRDLLEALRSSYTFIALALALGFAGGLTYMNVDYYVIVLFNASESEIALMLGISSLIASLITIVSSHIVRGDPWRAHSTLVLAQSILISLIPLTPTIYHAIILYTLRTAIAVISDAILDSMYTTIPPQHLSDLRIPLVVATWELSSGLGKLVGSHAIHVDPITTLLVGTLIALAYKILTILKTSEVNDTSSVELNIGYSLKPHRYIKNKNMRPRGDPNETTASEPPQRYKV